jgi:transposase InsO family protein
LKPLLIQTFVSELSIETLDVAVLHGPARLNQNVTDAMQSGPSPQSNGMAESFVKTLKRDYAKLANWPDSKTVMAQLKDWFDDYNSYHPHSALGYLPPTLFREKRSVT